MSADAILTAPVSLTTRRARSISPAAVIAVVLVVLLYSGWHFPTERYITPQRGFGYALGILGGSMMLLLFMYSARKRFRGLAFLGPTANWFRFHMLLGLAGPLCILYHANFHLGATNSNVALISMLTVAGSGVVGRYIYSRIHHGVYGSKLTLGELRSGSESLQSVSRSVAFIPELVQSLEAAEQRILTAGSGVSLLGFAKPLIAAVLAVHARLTLRLHIRRALKIAARKSSVIAAERRRLRRTTFVYIDKRISATRRLADFQAFERLFSLWHALHIPLIVMLLVAGIVHVIVVHLY